MKKLALFSLSLLFTFSIFGQVSKYPPKAVVVTLGEKHPDFDDSKYPNVDFYYVIKKKYKNPEGMLQGINEGDIFLFDKNGVLINFLQYSYNSDLGQAFYSRKRKKVVTDDQEFDYTYLDDYTKTYIKKGKVMKEKNVKSKHPERLSKDYMSSKLPDFKVTDKEGKEYSFNDIVSENPLTLVCFVYFDSWESLKHMPEGRYVSMIKNLNDGLKK
jgi:antitoxin component YwqK of YwqJK toxin-antitoxin module